MKTFNRFSNAFFDVVLYEFGKPSFADEKFVVRSNFRNTTVAHDNDAIATRKVRQTVRHQDSSLILTESALINVS